MNLMVAPSYSASILTATDDLFLTHIKEHIRLDSSSAKNTIEGGALCLSAVIRIIEQYKIKSCIVKRGLAVTAPSKFFQPRRANSLCTKQ